MKSEAVDTNNTNSKNTIVNHYTTSRKHTQQPKLTVIVDSGAESHVSNSHKRSSQVHQSNKQLVTFNGEKTPRGTTANTRLNITDANGKKLQMNIQTECVSRNEENEEHEPTKLILSTNELLNNNNNDLKTTKITPKKIDSITEILENNSYYIQTPQQANLVIDKRNIELQRKGNLWTIDEAEFEDNEETNTTTSKIDNQQPTAIHCTEATNIQQITTEQTQQLMTELLRQQTEQIRKQRQEKKDLKKTRQKEASIKSQINTTEERKEQHASLLPRQINSVNAPLETKSNLTGQYVRKSNTLDNSENDAGTQLTIGKVLPSNKDNTTFDHRTKYTIQYEDNTLEALATSRTILQLIGINGEPSEQEINRYEYKMQNSSDDKIDEPNKDTDEEEDIEDLDSDDKDTTSPNMVDDDRLHNDTNQEKKYIALSASLGNPGYDLLKRMVESDSPPGIKRLLTPFPKQHYKTIAEMVGKARQKTRGSKGIYKNTDKIGEAISMDTYTCPKENYGITGISNATIVEDKVSDLVKVFFHGNHAKDTTDLPTMKAIFDVIKTHFNNNNFYPKHLRVDQLPAWKGAAIKFNSDDFKSYTAKQGCETTTSSPRSSHQNLSENSMRTLFRIVTTAYINAKFHYGNEFITPSLWPILMAYASDVINARPKQGEKESPNKKFYGYDLPINRFHPILCPAAILHPKTGNNNTIAKDTIDHKFTERATMGLFAGFSRNSSGFRIWIPSNDGRGGSFRTSEHVVFDDNFSNAKFFTNNFTENTNTSINTADLNNVWLKECKLSLHQCVVDFNKSMNDESIYENNNNIFNDNQQINTCETIQQIQTKNDFFQHSNKNGFSPDETFYNIGTDNDELPYHDNTKQLPSTFRKESDKQFFINNIKLRSIEELNESTYKTPKSRRNALKDNYADGWKEAMDLEINSLKKIGALDWITKEEMEKIMKAEDVPQLTGLT